MPPSPEKQTLLKMVAAVLLRLTSPTTVPRILCRIHHAIDKKNQGDGKSSFLFSVDTFNWCPSRNGIFGSESRRAGECKHRHIRNIPRSTFDSATKSQEKEPFLDGH